MKGWRACVDAFTQDRQVRRYISECDALITAEQIEQVKATKPYLDREKAIVQASQGKQLNSGEFAAARDLLIYKFTILTGTRPGPLNNAIIDDFVTANANAENKIILVSKYKRSKDGPAVLGMDPELQHQMGIKYILHTSNTSGRILPRRA